MKIANYIAKKLTIKQRDYIIHHIKAVDFEGHDLDHIKSILESANIYEVRANLDIFKILAQIAKQDTV